MKKSIIRIGCFLLILSLILGYWNKVFKVKYGDGLYDVTTFYELEENTYIADTPGFSSFEISEIESTELDENFREFRQEIQNCEFVRMYSYKRAKLWNKKGYSR